MRHVFKIACLLIVIIFFSFKDKGDDEKSFEKFKQVRVKALVNNVIGREYQYNFVKRKDCNNTRIKYLGVVTTINKEKFKLLNSFYVVGPSCRGVSRIVIYNMKNRYIGNYYVGMPDNLPDTLINNNLIYLKDNDGCNVKKGTKISFEEGLPETIFIPCSNLDTGDLFTYSTEE